MRRTREEAEQTRLRVIAAALKLFSRNGYSQTTLAMIAAEAGYSRGPIYWHFRNKDELFEDFIPRGFTTELTGRVRAQVEALRSETNIFGLDDAPPYRRASEDLLAFTIAHRERVVFLLLRAQGTKHERFSNDVVRLLVELAIEHAHATYPTFAVTPATKRTLTRIYRGFVATLGAILAEERAEHAVREAVARHATYHLSGLKALFLSAKTREASR